MPWPPGIKENTTTIPTEYIERDTIEQMQSTGGEETHADNNTIDDGEDDVMLFYSV